GTVWTWSERRGGDATRGCAGPWDDPRPHAGFGFALGKAHGESRSVAARATVRARVLGNAGHPYRRRVGFSAGLVPVAGGPAGAAAACSRTGSVDGGSRAGDRSRLRAGGR